MTENWIQQPRIVSTDGVKYLLSGAELYKLDFW